MYHFCHGAGQQDTFNCGYGTVFNEYIGTCDYKNNVQCASGQGYAPAPYAPAPYAPAPYAPAPTPAPYRPAPAPYRPPAHQSKPYEASYPTTGYRPYDYNK